MVATLEGLLTTAQRHGLHLTAERDDLDTSGLDYVVAHARDDAGMRWIVRAPRRHDAYIGTLAEARTLALLRGRIPVAVPDWRVHTADLIAYPRLEGEPACTFDKATGVRWNGIDPSAPSATFLDSLAEIFASMHAIDAGAAAGAGVPSRTIAEVRGAYASAMEDARSVLGVSDRLFRRWQGWLADDDLWPPFTALVHGDLHPGHMLLDAEGRIVGLLDWTEAEVADPSVDFAMFLGCFGRAALEALVERYHRAGGRAWPRLVEHAAERWAAYAVLVVAWARKSGNEAVIEHARAHVAAIDSER